MTPVALIDYGAGNVASVRFALERLGAPSMLTADADEIRSAARVILPGVGAASQAMQRLTAMGLDRLIPALTQPVLGICLGMQLLFETSEEGPCTCLGVFKGVARRIAPGPSRPVPHMGWNQLELIRPNALLEGIEGADYAYFVHSYALPMGPDTIATCHYGSSLSACVAQRNFYGTQFHPERSSELGARLLANFLQL